MSALAVTGAVLNGERVGLRCDTTVVAGRVLMRGGKVEGTAEIVAHAAERARRLGIG